MPRKKHRLHKFMCQEKTLWHKHFIPSLIAAIAMLTVALFTTFTPADMILFASFGATATVLTHMKKHHLTKLHTVLISYSLALISGFIVYFINLSYDISLPLDIFITVFLTSIGMMALNSFHPPAVGAGISFFLSNVKMAQTLHIISGALILFLIIRFLTYVLSKHLPLSEFYKEFRREL